MEFLPQARNLISPAKQCFLPGLSRIKMVANALGNPHNKFRSIHVGGTNGKGSVCIKIMKLLQLQGLNNIGVYSSPHICTIRERIRVGNQMIPLSEFWKFTEQVENTAKKHQIALSSFEVITLVAFLHFAHSKVPWAVIEVGLGGTDDATNIIASSYSIITSISLDHTAVLGNTLESIATHKAGIIKPHCSVIVGPHCHPLAIFEKKTVEEKSKLYIAQKNHSDENDSIVETFSRAFVENEKSFSDPTLFLGQALRCNPWLRFQRLTHEEMEQALQTSLAILSMVQTKMEQFMPKRNYSSQIILDVAHNEDGYRYLIEKLKKEGVIPMKKDYDKELKTRIGFALSRGRPLSTIQRLVELDLSGAVEVHYLPLPHSRVYSLEELCAMEKDNPQMKCFVERLLERKCNVEKRLTVEQTNPDDYFTIVCAQHFIDCWKEKAPLVICGSFFLFGPLLRTWGLVNEEEFDPIDLNERVPAGSSMEQEHRDYSWQLSKHALKSKFNMASFRNGVNEK